MNLVVRGASTEGATLVARVPTRVGAADGQRCCRPVTDVAQRSGIVDGQVVGGLPRPPCPRSDALGLGTGRLARQLRL
jgi:hypothetical protein